MSEQVLVVTLVVYNILLAVVSCTSKELVRQSYHTKLGYAFSLAVPTITGVGIFCDHLSGPTVPMVQMTILQGNILSRDPYLVGMPDGGSSFRNDRLGCFSERACGHGHQSTASTQTGWVTVTL